MQFIVIAFDGTDPEAASRRLVARPAHLQMVEQATARGEQILGVAILNDDKKMIGSLMVMDFPSRSMLDAWLEREPYVIGKVWEKIDVYNGAIPPSFSHLLKK
ncbi:MAG: YciI family protein [Alphaproteobacteria bacterium]|nr:YciI family protein [Alphaproteobacteria bacterium]